MRRRTVITGAAASAMLAAAGARAQQAASSLRIAVLVPLAGLAATPYVAALQDQLAKHGFVEGKNLTVDVRFPFDFSLASAHAAAREAVASRPDAIFVCTTVLALAAQRTAPSTPIVFAWVGDPVRAGLVPNLAKPGGMVSGVTNRFLDLTPKRIELVRELVPSATRVAVIAGVFDASLVAAMEEAERAAERLGITLLRVTAGTNWEGALDESIAEKADAVLVTTPFAMFGLRFAADAVVKRSIEKRIRAVLSDVETVELGGLIGYATNLASDIRRGADVLARVLRGEKPGDIAVDQAERFELAINLKTARAIGLNVPQSLLLRADRVVE